MINNTIKLNTIQKSDLLLLGEILIDLYTDDQGHKHTLFGGSPANICLNTKQLGLNPLLVSTIGDDDYGDFLMSQLQKHKIDTRFIKRCDKKTSLVRLNQTVDSPKPTFFRGCDYNINLSNQLIEAVKKSKIFHFSYWPLTKEPAKSTVMALVDIAVENNCIVSFDPNIHKDILDDSSITNEELISLLKKVNIIKPSLDDAARLFDFISDKESYMEKFEDLGINLIMMTLGKDGVYVSNNKKRKHYKAYAKVIVDSTGAGDAFWSGFYGGFLNNLSIEESIELGQITSGFALKQIGAQVDLPHIDYLKKYMRHDL